jgi:2-C-methyl-D-erythritol 4-phosphate cytidylyltransferase
MNAPKPPSHAAVLLAAGLSTRMQTEEGVERKPFLVLEGRTVLEHAALAFDRAPSIRDVVIVGHREDLARIERLVVGGPAFAKVRAVVAGGELRIDSVRAGIAALGPEVDLVAIHDAARALVEPELVERAIECASLRDAALVAVPVTDTIKTSADGQHASTTLDRSVLWAAQTPQVFRLALLRLLLDRAAADSFHPTDDAALYEKYVGGTPLVRGEPSNLKLTTPADLVVAAAILRARERRPGERR